MSVIIPAILESEINSFNEKAELLIKKIEGVHTVQVDFCDNEFVDNQTITVAQIDTLNPALMWEAHLMVKNPKNFLDYKIAGFNKVILHYEAFDTETGLEDALFQIKSNGLESAIAINPQTPVSVLRYFGDTINHFTLLSVHPGRQGQPFLEETYNRINELRQLLPHVTIEVDGGINVSNIKKVFDAGANFIIAGSSLFNGGDISENYIALEQALIKK